MIIVGLDLSLASPGIAVYDTATTRWSLYGFAQRVREQNLEKTSGGTTIRLFPAIPRDVCNEARYEHVRAYLVDRVLAPYADEPEVVIGIECYAFGARHSGSSYKLQELGGVIKHSIWQRFPGWVQLSIPPTQWKKLTLGRGQATKLAVVEYVAGAGPCLPLVTLLGTALGKQGAVPSPAQDLADAVCVALSVTLLG